MKILYSIHGYPPNLNAGAEMMLHDLAKFFISNGHEVKVLIPEPMATGILNPYEFDGVWVYPKRKNSWEDMFKWADVVFTHLGQTPFAIQTCKLMDKPCVFFAHNTWVYQEIQEAEGRNNVFVVYNSEFAKDELAYKLPNYILNPPCDWRKYDLGKDPFNNRYITIINFNENKGGMEFFEIARRMKDRRFLAVRGSYGEQCNMFPDNVRVVDNTTEILKIYGATRILCMPSAYESWGRTATEAMCNGIPVIAAPTSGLEENLGKAGLFCKRDRINEWVEQINHLDDRDIYNYASKKCRERSRELDPVPQMEGLLKFIECQIGLLA